MHETYFPRAGGSGHRQHLALLQVQADVFEDGRDVEVGEEEAGVTVQVSARFVLLLDLLEQLADALQKSSKMFSSYELKSGVSPFTHVAHNMKDHPSETG